MELVLWRGSSMMVTLGSVVAHYLLTAVVKMIVLGLMLAAQVVGCGAVLL
jgi:hypothetical protein